MSTLTTPHPAPKRTQGAPGKTLQAVDPDERSFSGLDQARLWFVFGVGLLVIQSGTFLPPMVGTRAVWVAVVLGSIVGSGILAWVARLGCATGLASAGLMAHVFGGGFSRLPVTLNVLQLIGWTTFELVILRSAVRALAAHASGLPVHAWLAGAVVTVACGAALALLLSIPMVTLVHRVVGRFDLPMELLALVWVTWELASHVVVHPAAAPLRVPPHGRFGAALDLVIAMPVSWLPLVADYSRHARLRSHAPRTTLAATWAGYATANVWGYGLGVLIMSAALPSADMAATIALVPGGLVALALMTAHEFSNLYGGAYSASVSGSSLHGRGTVRVWGLGVALVCTVLALLLPMHSLEPFLLLLSSIFVPLFGVILGRLTARRSTAPPIAVKRIDLGATAIWIAGIALYQGLTHWAPQYGSALPTLAATFAAAWLTRPRPRAARSPADG